MEFVLTITALVLSVVIHEYAHGWVASKRGDETARLAGRLTLNPLKHIDPVGTILVPLMLRLMHVSPLGWAKPVPVNFAKLHNPRRDMILVAAAGPAVNFLAACVFTVLLKSDFLFALLPTKSAGYVFIFFVYLIYINLLLGVFNLIPLPPLDGSRIMVALLPQPLARMYHQLEPFGLVILIILLNLGFLDFVGKIVSLLFDKLGPLLLPS